MSERNCARTKIKSIREAYKQLMTYNCIATRQHFVAKVGKILKSSEFKGEG